MTNPMHYRKKPVIIEAMRLDGTPTIREDLRPTDREAL